MTETKTGFPERFDRFLKAFDLNTNKLAVELQDTNPVKYRRWLAGEASPAYEHLRLIALKYGVSLDWLALGEGEMLRGGEATARQPATQPPQPDPVADVLLKQQAAYIAKLEQKLEKLEARNEALTDQVVRLSEMGFLPSGSQPPASHFYESRMTVAGFGREPQVQPQARIGLINIFAGLGLSQEAGRVVVKPRRQRVLDISHEIVEE